VMCSQTQPVVGSPTIYSFLADKSGCSERTHAIDTENGSTLRYGAKLDACNQQEESYRELIQQACRLGYVLSPAYVDKAKYGWEKK
jgi:hypothetical protein